MRNSRILNIVIPAKDAHPTTIPALLSLTKMRNPRIPNIVIPAKAGIHLVLTDENGSPLSRG
jgi:hypothetical protein